VVDLSRNEITILPGYFNWNFLFIFSAGPIVWVILLFSYDHEPEPDDWESFHVTFTYASKSGRPHYNHTYRAVSYPMFFPSGVSRYADTTATL
jgi:hypothetical protein